MARALGRYELLRPLARGGMADVYLARRRSAGIEKWLVVKRMRPERSGDPRFLDLFVREARLSMSLVHQNIVPVFDFGKIDDQVFLAMERVEGKDLGSSLARAADHRLPPLLAAFIAAECCQALDYAHQRKGPDGVALGIVHRDVTPRNVLLSWSGEVKLTDFGIAALAGDATSRLLGTPHYMAPEQARSEPIDPRADIYAIGLILREAITGRRPRPGTDRDAILDAARRGDLVPWALDAAAASGGAEASGEPLPDALVAIVDRATSTNPADRYPVVRAMLDDLDSFIVGQRAAHRAESPGRQLGAWLTGVWEGARDDLDADAAVDAEHLVSFIDDGAIDLLGTGTMRSMAATAAEDVHGGARVVTGSMTPPPLPRGATPASGLPPAATPATGLPRAADAGGRRSRISSNNQTVASGSFHTIPEPGARVGRSSGAVAPMRGRRTIPPWLSITVAVVAVATAAIVIALNSREPDRGPSPAAADAPARGAQGLGNADLAASTSAAPAGAPMPSGDGSSGQPAGKSSDQPSDQATAPPNPGPQVLTAAASGSSAGPPRKSAPDARNPSSTRTGRPDFGPGGRPSAGHPNPGQPGPDRPDPGHPAPSPGDGAADTDSPSPPPCHVRINLTPWAYYTADGEPTRHETPSTIDLAPGQHRLHVWNPELGVERDVTISVPADRNTMNFSEPLRPTTIAP